MRTRTGVTNPSSVRSLPFVRPLILGCLASAALALGLTYLAPRAHGQATPAAVATPPPVPPAPAAAPTPASTPAVATTPEAAPATLDPLDEAIRAQVDALRYDSDRDLRGAKIVLGDVVAQFYESRTFRDSWTNPSHLDRLIGALDELVNDGLDPTDYHVAALRSFQADRRTRALTVEEQADLEMLATDAMVLGLYHLYVGKVDPVGIDSRWNYGERPINAQNAYVFLAKALASGRVTEAFDEVRPKHPWYRALREQLRRYRALAAAGGWPTIPSGPTLKPGMTDPSVAELRQRLRMTDDFAGPDLSSETYDTALEDGVKRYQQRNGLTADGVVGPAVRAALNVTALQRVDQLRVNLERGRWVLHEITGDFVLVDIAGFYVTLFRNNEAVWNSRVVVGKPYRATPIFRSKITYVVLNPTWTIPPGILASDTLPAIKRNPGYLTARKIRVIDRNGREVNPHSVNWQQYSRSIPYQLVQDPGPENSLGLVKIMFPNPYLVYLHDSPAKSLYERDDRAFSSGCIRVQKPFELTERVLDDPVNWNAAAIDAVIKSGRTRTVNLKTPLDVLILYWTAQPSTDGSVQFRPDVYGRDPPTLKALNSDFKLPSSELRAPVAQQASSG